MIIPRNLCLLLTLLVSICGCSTSQTAETQTFPVELNNHPVLRINYHRTFNIVGLGVVTTCVLATLPASGWFAVWMALYAAYQVVFVHTVMKDEYATKIDFLLHIVNMGWFIWSLAMIEGSQLTRSDQRYLLGIHAVFAFCCSLSHLYYRIIVSPQSVM